MCRGPSIYFAICIYLFYFLVSIVNTFFWINICIFLLFAGVTLIIKNEYNSYRYAVGSTLQLFRYLFSCKIYN